ncbi:glycosyltransferase family 2 protein [Robertkochia solimangrovi]|uniref:glycosyltransferase family 2 protein n=1 Tax=Robertkochia solimangrovi TaxID=2213046 RepID=UPI00117DE168|nr:glycosyltransferase [Robertkochia solimangrovi]TRZ44980.1 hypothetical protein DMZ48_04255 [Robertkochia solimangrovi]
MPKVSVVIPNYNHEKFLERRIDSVLGQTYKDYELIILDDQSTDNSSQIIEKYVNKNPELIKYFPNSNNSGSPFHQWNKGIELAVGEFIWIAESDDLADNNFLEEMTSVLENDSDIGLVSCISQAIDQDDRIISEIHPVVKPYANDIYPVKDEVKIFKGEYFIRHLLIKRCLIPNISGVLFRKQCYLDSGGLNIDYSRIGDFELYFRMFNNFDVAFLHKSLNYTRYHDDKLSATNTRVSFEELSRLYTSVFNTFNVSWKERQEIVAFYYTVYKHDIFYNKKFTYPEKLSIFHHLGKISPRTYKEFIRFFIGHVLYRTKTHFR